LRQKLPIVNLPIIPSRTMMIIGLTETNTDAVAFLSIHRTTRIANLLCTRASV
jgi:hypothetical protein